MFNSMDARRRPSGGFVRLLKLYLGFSGDQGGGEPLQVRGNAYLSGYLKQGAPPFLDVYIGVNTVAFASGGNIQIPYDTIVTDNQGWFNTSTKVYTPLVAGRYRVTVAVFISGTTTSIAQNTSVLELSVRKTNSLFARKIIRAQAAIVGSMGWAGSLTVDVIVNGSTDFIDATAYTDLTSPNFSGNLGARSIDSWMQITYEGAT